MKKIVVLNGGIVHNFKRSLHGLSPSVTWMEVTRQPLRAVLCGAPYRARAMHITAATPERDKRTQRRIPSKFSIMATCK
jgi:hypothetical protein